MKRTAIGFALIVLLMTGMAWSQMSDTVQKFEGRVTSVDAAARSFTVADASQSSLIFYWDDDTQVLQGEEESDALAVAEGVEVSVAFKTKNEKNWALKIQIRIAD